MAIMSSTFHVEENTRVRVGKNENSGTPWVTITHDGSEVIFFSRDPKFWTDLAGTAISAAGFAQAQQDAKKAKEQGNG